MRKLIFKVAFITVSLLVLTGVVFPIIISSDEMSLSKIIICVSLLALLWVNSVLFILDDKEIKKCLKKLW